MENEFIYWQHPTPVGIRVEEVSGMTSKSGKLWMEMAKQIYCENGRDSYREIGHFADGAPFLFSMPTRISITHTSHLLAVASLPKTPEAEMAHFSQRTALGIDAESLDRSQVLKVRSKFLSETEMEMVPADSLEKNVIAWTAKEALYKAALTPGLDFRTQIRLKKLPEIDRQMNLPGAPPPVLGLATVAVGIPEEGNPTDPSTGSSFKIYEFNLYSYESDGCCITLAFSPKCAKFSRK